MKPPDHRAERLKMLSLVTGGGNETVARALSWAGALLAQHQDQRQMLVEDPSLILQAVEETLRYEAPSPVQARVTTREVTLHGVTIPEGSAVLLLTNSANRDEREFADADRFDITRSPRQHLAFGFGTTSAPARHLPASRSASRSRRRSNASRHGTSTGPTSSAPIRRPCAAITACPSSSDLFEAFAK